MADPVSSRIPGSKGVPKNPVPVAETTSKPRLLDQVREAIRDILLHLEG